MGAVLSEKRNVKIFVLYLLENINYPLDYVTINDLVMQNDFVAYFDFAQCFSEMVDDGLILSDEVDGTMYYGVSDKGRAVARTLKTDILPSILERSLASALRFLSFKKQNAEVKCFSEPREDGRHDMICRILKDKEEIFSIKMTVDSKVRVEKMKDRFRDRPELIYRGVCALLEGKVDYLFD